MAATDTTVFLGEFETKTALELETRPPGTYYIQVMVRCNSLLSSVFVKACAGGATVKANYYDTTTGDSTTPERYDLNSHVLLGTADVGDTNRILVTKIHNKPILEVVVTGGAVEFGVYITAVTETASDLDASLKLHLQDADISEDKGLVVAGYDAVLDKFFLLPIEGGAVKVVGTLSLAELVSAKAQSVTVAVANTEQSHVFPAGTRKFLLKGRSPGKILVSHAAGDIALGAYVTVYPGAFYVSEQFAASAKTVYFQSPMAGLVIELESWI